MSPLYPIRSPWEMWDIFSPSRECFVLWWDRAYGLRDYLFLKKRSRSSDAFDFGKRRSSRLRCLRSWPWECTRHERACLAPWSVWRSRMYILIRWSWLYMFRIIHIKGLHIESPLCGDSTRWDISCLDQFVRLSLEAPCRECFDYLVHIRKRDDRNKR